ncbi:MAG: N-acetylmuramoyl-L-alanine amidase [bacterium]
MSSKVFLLAFIGFSFVVLSGCAAPRLYKLPADWEPDAQERKIALYSRCLSGWRICIDPGHGGEARPKTGPTGLMEAEVNLRVARHLRDFLVRAGAEVKMTRDSDTYVSLRERARVANEWGADLFVSVHHNSAGQPSDVNYTSMWYHASPDANSASEDLANYVQNEVSYLLGLPSSLASFTGSLSDYTIYPDSGFAVLRYIKMPGILGEASFYDEPTEEQRLKQEEYNRIEAWGYFRGIAKYICNGIPSLEFLGPETSEARNPILKVRATDGLGGVDLKPDSIRVGIDGEPAVWDFDPYSGTILISPKRGLSGGAHTLSVVVRNSKGNASLPFERKFTISPPIASLQISAYPGEIPPDGVSQSLIEVSALDDMGDPVADGRKVEFKTSSGSFRRLSNITSGGMVSGILVSGRKEDIAVVEVSGDGTRAKASVVFRKSGMGYATGGVIDSRTRRNIPGVRVSTGESAFVTRGDGRYYLGKVPPGQGFLRATKAGYYGHRRVVQFPPDRSTSVDISMVPVADGILFGRKFVLDPRYGGQQGGDVGERGLRGADVNLHIALYLRDLLRASGAEVVLTREGDETLNVIKRVEVANAIDGDLYLRIQTDLLGYDPKRFAVAGLIYPGHKPSEEWATPILRNLAGMLAAENAGIVSSEDYEMKKVIFPTVGVNISSILNPSVEEKLGRPSFLADVAWGIYIGILEVAGYEGKVSPGVSGRVMDAQSNLPLEGAKVFVDDSLFDVTDPDGHFNIPIVAKGIHYYGISGAESARVVIILENEIR